MKKHYVFRDRHSFQGADSQELAAALALSPPALRALREKLGISLEIEASPLRLSHDGRKIGIASVPSKRGDISIAVAPKLESVHVRAILDELTESTQDLPQFFVSSETSTTDVKVASEDLSVGFLLALLREIISVAPSIRGLSAKRHSTYVRGGMRGRPLIEKSLVRMLLGQSLGFTCEILSDKHLKEYQSVLLATGLSILETLGIWVSILNESDFTPESTRGILVSGFQSLDPVNISFSDVLRICRPPFPFGLRDVLYRCLRYWRWRGSYLPSSESIGRERFVSLSLNLDELFELYVGAAFERASAGGLQHNFKQTWPYLIERQDEQIQRDIELDHLFAKRDESMFIIVDAKYTDRIAYREHVYQIVSYVNYVSSKYPDAQVCGVLVYPGDYWQLGTIKNFDQQLYVMNIPVPIRDSFPKLQNFLEPVL